MAISLEERARPGIFSNSPRPGMHSRPNEPTVTRMYSSPNKPPLQHVEEKGTRPKQARVGRGIESKTQARW